MIRQNRRDLPKDNSNRLELEVLRYDWKKEKNEKRERRGWRIKKKSNEKGWKEIALHMFNLRADTGFNSYAIGYHKVDTGIEDKDVMDPVTHCTKPSSHSDIS